MNDMDRSEMQPAKASLVKKIMWGGLIAGAVIGVAAVVGFVFFPAESMAVLNASQDAIGSMFENVAGGVQWVGGKLGVGKEVGTDMYQAIQNAGKFVSEKIIGGYNPEAAKSAAAAVVDAKSAAWAESAQHNAVAAQQHWLGGWNPLAWLDRTSPPTAQVDVLKKTAEAAATGTGIVGFIMKYNILSLAAAGIGALAVTKASEVPDNRNEHSAQYRDAQESFAMREDMRKMQAVMVARARAAGWQPAMAEQGRA